MKKFTLMLIATFVAVAGMAIGTQKHAIAKQFISKKVFATPSIAQKVDVSGGFATYKKSMKLNAIKASIVKADEEPATDEPALDVKSGILAKQYTYDEVGGGMFKDYPVEEVAYAVDGTTLAVQLNSYVIIAGTIGEGTNELKDYGYEVVTFKAGEVMATLKATGEELVLKACDWDSKNYAPVPTDAETFVGYVYMDENGQVENIYIPEILALVGETSGVVMAGANYDIYDCSAEDGTVFVSTVTGEDYPETQGGENEVIENVGKAFFWLLHEDQSLDVLISGVNNWWPEAWTMVTIAADGTTAKIANNQYVGHGAWESLNAEAAFYSCAFGAPNADGYVTRVDEGVTLNLEPSDEGDLFVADESATFYVVGQFDDANDDEYSGIYSKTAGMKILISNEPAEPITGIQEVQTEKKSIFSAASYNLAGQKVGKGYKGLIIRDGKKYIVK
ncbi:MAG: hypothetical protein IJV19_02045 [Prevotella sp.]|nr:hypothetical protein [Prevotella sp.]